MMEDIVLVSSHIVIESFFFTALGSIDMPKEWPTFITYCLLFRRDSVSVPQNLIYEWELI